MFTFIHTSDWHLGQNFYGYDRSEEQRDFLEQLAGIVHKHQPDALLVSGDIFHTAAPSNAAVNLYVNALLDIRSACKSTQIIVIAGNHDSASRLDSDRRLWELAEVHVLGGIARDDKGNARLQPHLINVNGKGIVAAVPFAYPGSFPLVKEGQDVERDQRQQAYFQALVDQANVAGGQGQLPVVLMAHLAVNNSDLTGHTAGMMECVDIATLGQGYDYVALGHIHRPQQLSGRVRYCGTPVPVSFDEQCEHSVSIVEIDAHGAMPRIETKRINNIKPLHTLPPSGPVNFDDALELLQALNPNDRSYIRLDVLVDRYLPSGAQERAAMATRDKHCRFCEIKKTSTDAERLHAPGNALTREQFSKMPPIEVVNRFLSETQGRPMSDQERDMFNYVYQLVQEETRQ